MISMSNGTARTENIITGVENDETSRSIKCPLDTDLDAGVRPEKTISPFMVFDNAVTSLSVTNIKIS